MKNLLAPQKDFDRWNTEKKRLDVGEGGAHCHEREIWWCSIGVNVGSEQHSQTDDFSRPVVVVWRFTEDIFWGIPLTTKIKEQIPFRFRLMVGDITNDALVLQMRAYDRKRLVRQIGVVSQNVFAMLTAAISDAVKTTDPAFAESSGAEANVYEEGYTSPSEKSTDSKGGVDKAHYKNETTALADGGFSEARVLLKESELQRETARLRTNARHSGCQPATALGMGCVGIIT